jgi:hypothetical protein
MILVALEIACPAAFASRFAGIYALTLSFLDGFERHLAIAAVRASTRGSSAMMATVMSSGNMSPEIGWPSGAGSEERWVTGDDAGDLEPRERLRSSLSSATGLSCFAAGRAR